MRVLKLLFIKYILTTFDLKQQTFWYHKTGHTLYVSTLQIISINKIQNAI